MAGKITGGHVTFTSNVEPVVTATFAFEGELDTSYVRAKFAELLGGAAVAKPAKVAKLAIVKPDPAAVTETLKETPSAAEVVEDDDFSAVATKEITDAELQDAMAKKKQALSHFLSPPEPTKKIKALAAKFVKAGSTQLSDMPQDVRAQFLAELEALKP